MRDQPYFMSDRKWFKFDFNSRRYVLTEFAPPKARDSYEEYIKELEKDGKYQNNRE